MLTGRIIYWCKFLPPIAAVLVSFPLTTRLFDSSLLSLYPPSSSNDMVALEYGRQIRDAFHAGQPGRQLNAYVNYASGNETVEQMYGHEDWRLEKLRRLKGEWDPRGRFGFYHPIR